MLIRIAWRIGKRMFPLQLFLMIQLNKDIYRKSLYGKLVVGESQRGAWTYQMSTVIYWTGKYFHLNFEIYFSLHKYFCSYWSQVFTPLSNLFWSLLLQVINLGIIKEINFGSTVYGAEKELL